MEPVIKKSPYHHVLLMRDDKEVVSFKVHSKVLWYSLACSIVLVTLGLTGTIYGVKTWQKSHSLKAKYEATSSEPVEARLQLEQLSNLQTLIATSDSPAPVFKFNEIQMPLQREGEAGTEGEAGEGGEAPSSTETKGTEANSTTSPEGNVQGSEGQTAEGQKTEGQDSSAEQAVTEQNSANGANSSNGLNGSSDSATSSSDGEVENSTADTAQANTEKATEANQGEATGQAESDKPSQALSIADETSPVRINNLFSKTAARNRIQLSFDLVTNKQDAFVRGETTYRIELQDGALHDIKPNFLDDSRFAISRMKNFDLTANLPQGIKGTQIKNILISITLDSGETFSSSYPFAQ